MLPFFSRLYELSLSPITSLLGVIQVVFHCLQFGSKPFHLTIVEANTVLQAAGLSSELVILSVEGVDPIVDSSIPLFRIVERISHLLALLV
jgi:hypothetical protein